MAAQPDVSLLKLITRPFMEEIVVYLRIYLDLIRISCSRVKKEGLLWIN